jgi:hypothetical protein
MAATNLIQSQTINGKIAGTTLTTNFSPIGVVNSSGSNQIYKINNITISNITGTTAGTITVSVYKNSTTHLYLAYQVTIPANSSLALISSVSHIYLEENDQIYASCSANNTAQIIVSYEIIS